MQLAIMRGSKTTVDAISVHILFKFGIGIIIPVMRATVKLKQLISIYNQIQLKVYLMTRKLFEWSTDLITYFH